MAIFLFFQNNSHLPLCISYLHVWTTQEKHLVVFITVQNLVGIDPVHSIRCNCWYSLAFPIRTPKWRFLGNSTYMGNSHIVTPKATSYHRSTWYDM